MTQASLSDYKTIICEHEDGVFRSGVRNIGYLLPLALFRYVEIKFTDSVFGSVLQPFCQLSQEHVQFFPHRCRSKAHVHDNFDGLKPYRPSGLFFLTKLRVINRVVYSITTL